MTTMVLSLLLLAKPAGADAASAQGVAKRLYVWYLDAKPAGLPTAVQMKRLSPLLSTRLQGLFREAAAYQKRFAGNPDEKPPFVDGCLFTSLFEGPTAFTVGAAEAAPDGGWRVVVDLTYRDPSDAQQVVRWKDTVMVREEKGHAVVDDILFGGEWAFKTGDSLSALLRSRD